MSSTATKIALVSTTRAQTDGMRRHFGARPLVLRAQPKGPGGWWGTIASANPALFDTEAEARAWLVRTFDNPIDRSELTTMEVRVVRRMDAAAR